MTTDPVLLRRVPTLWPTESATASTVSSRRLARQRTHSNGFARGPRTRTIERRLANISSLAGYEVLTEGRGSNAGTLLLDLKPWSERKESIAEIVGNLEKKAKQIPGATIEFFEPPAVPGYGAAGGFQLQLLDKTNSGDYKALEKVNEEFKVIPDVKDPWKQRHPE